MAGSYGDTPAFTFLCAMRYRPMSRLNRVVTPVKQGRKPKGDVEGAEVKW